MENLKPFLEETLILNFSDIGIQRLLASREWAKKPEYEKILGTYNFVRDEIKFGYNRTDEIPASEVLKDGYGQCNTKSTLFMALLRSTGIPCRFHGFTIDKKLQKGAVRGVLYLLAPREIIHSWVEIHYRQGWVNMEGFILDKTYLNNLQKMFPDHTSYFCGFGVATKNFQNPPVEWNGNDTYIQSEGIVRDLGVFGSPDEFYAKEGSNLSGFKKIIFTAIVRKIMNNNVDEIRRKQSC